MKSYSRRRGNMNSGVLVVSLTKNIQDKGRCISDSSEKYKRGSRFLWTLKAKQSLDLMWSTAEAILDLEQGSDMINVVS